MSGVHDSCCPSASAGQAVTSRTDESLGILHACSSEASVIDGQYGFGNRYLSVGGFWHKERNILEYILKAMLSRCPAIWIMTVRISSSSSEGIQILGMRCQPLIASQRCCDDLR